MKKSKTCCLFTDSYPYDIYFEQFVANEAIYLSNTFETVFVFTCNVKDTIRECPANFIIVDLNALADFSIHEKIKAVFPSIILILQEITGAKHKWLYVSRFKDRFKQAFNATIVAKGLQNWLKLNAIDLTTTVFYSYWCLHPMLVLARLKKNTDDILIVTRAHTEMYEDIFDKLYSNFNYVKYRSAKYIYCISQHAANYIKSFYPEFSPKIKVSYLGTFDKGFTDTVASGTFLVVSCSTIHSRKRIHLITEILKRLPFRVKWVHFGAGDNDDYEQGLKKNIAAFPSNIEGKLMGFVKNEEILKYYLSEPVNLFINVSSEEGLPVSLIEAASFGIPLLGTNIMGTPEVVSYTNGILVEKDFDPGHVAKLISTNKEKLYKRKEIRDLWLNRFNAEKNYGDFFKELASLAT